MTETRLLLQRLYVLTQRFNAILLHDSFLKEEKQYCSLQLDFCCASDTFSSLGIEYCKKYGTILPSPFYDAYRLKFSVAKLCKNTSNSPVVSFMSSKE